MTVPDHPARPVLERLAAVAAADPERPALVTDTDRLTFGELARGSAAVAAGLAARGAGPGSLVALCLPRGADLVLALLGVLRAGAAYLPLDAGYPPERLRYLLADSGASLVLTGPGPALPLPEGGGAAVLTLDELAGPAAGFADAAISPGSLAYTIYTSGSSGRPKGVDVTHAGLAALLAGIDSVLGTARTRVGWNASVSFDASVQQWVRLCRGDTIVIVTERVRADPEALAALIAAEGVDDLDITPSQLSVLLDYLRPARPAVPLRLLVGGEPVSPRLWQELASLTESGLLSAVNLYGPTECTVDATATVIGGGQAHLGEPFPGMRLYLLDGGLRPAAAGTAGEIFLAGPQVARGYRSRPALTAERFLADPFAADGTRMYRTGDRARRREDGSLEFLGRIDRQVKIRGHRVEPAEIEHALASSPHVRAAVVVPREDLAGGPGLAGYVLAAGPVDPAILRADLARQLPEYMIPAAIMVLAAMPLLPSGKIDWAALPPPPRPASGPAGDELHGPSEHLVAGAWAAVLGVEQIAATDHFFRLGGHSLQAIQVAARLRQGTGRPIPLVAVFENPRLRDLARYLDGQERRAAHG